MTGDRHRSRLRPGRWDGAPRIALRFRPVVAKPTGETGFVDLARCKTTDHEHRFRFCNENVDVVRAEKGHERQQRRTFVAVDEGVVFDDADGVGGREFGQVRFTVARTVFGSPGSRFEYTLVAQARRPAEKLELL